MTNNRAYLVIAGIALLAGCSAKTKQASEAGAEAATPVQVATAKRESIHHIVTAAGVLYPVKQADIVPKISAPIARYLVQRGDHVHQGQLLAVLEDRDLLASAQESKSLYEQAQAAYQTTARATMPEDMVKATADVASARQTLDAATKVYQSREELLRQGALARKLVDDAKVALVQAQSQFDTAQQHLKLLESVGRGEQLKSIEAQRDAAKAHYEGAEAQVSYAEIRSPLDGVISDRPLNVGEMASSSSAVMSILDISHVIARANVPVREAAAIHVGRAATISAPDGEASGKVTVVSPAVDPNTTTVEVWVEAANPGERLKPGVTVQISVDAAEIENAIVVPTTALLSADVGGDKVMVAGSDSLAHERKVQVGVRDGDRVQIVDGVKDGEQVIVAGALGLDDKAKIEITKSGGEASDAK